MKILKLFIFIVTISIYFSMNSGIVNKEPRKKDNSLFLSSLTNHIIENPFISDTKLERIEFNTNGYNSTNNIPNNQKTVEVKEKKDSSNFYVFNVRRI